MAHMRYCSVCGHDVRDYAKHVMSREHQRNLHPAGSRRSSRANARRERERVARKRFGSRRAYNRDQDAHFSEELRYQREEQRRTGRHWYGAWSPWGVSAFMGGHPGHAIRRLHRHVRHHLTRDLAA